MTNNLQERDLQEDQKGQEQLGVSIDEVPTGAITVQLKERRDQIAGEVTQLLSQPPRRPFRSENPVIERWQNWEWRNEGGKVYYGKFELREVISGTKGKNVLYKAFDPDLDREVVMKISMINSSEEEERFIREVQNMAKHNHPNVLKVFMAGKILPDQEEGHLRLATVMEIGHGSLLDEQTEVLKMEKEEKRKYFKNTFLPLARALSQVHRQHLHRDVKPGNIIRRGDGTPCLADFELSRRKEETIGLKGIEGTPFFMAPENILEEQIDETSDWFSFAATIYTMFTGKYLFSKDYKSGRELLRDIGNSKNFGKDEEMLREWRRELSRAKVPKEISACLIRMLEPNKNYRMAPSEVLQYLEDASLPSDESKALDLENYEHMREGDRAAITLHAGQQIRTTIQIGDHFQPKLTKEGHFPDWRYVRLDPNSLKRIEKSLGIQKNDEYSVVIDDFRNKMIFIGPFKTPGLPETISVPLEINQVKKYRFEA